MSNILPKPANKNSILCGGKWAEPNAEGYSGCDGTGSYRKGQKCFRCNGLGWQTEVRWRTNHSYDTLVEEKELVAP